MKRIVYLIFCLSLSLGTYSQELKVKSFTLASNDLEARTNPVVDKTDNPCALVKIPMGNEIANVDGFVISIKDHYGEKWVYLTDGSKEIVIFPKHGKSLRVYFPDYGFKGGIKGKCTYVLDWEAVVVNKPVENHVVTHYNLEAQDKIKVASANDDWKTIEQMAASGESMAYFPLAKHYLAVKKYDMADSFAQKAYSARVDMDKAKLVIQYLAKLGYYDDKEFPACLKNK